MRLQAELVHHLEQAAAADLVAGDERVAVAFDLHRLAHVGAHDAQHGARSCAALDELQRAA